MKTANSTAVKFIIVPILFLSLLPAASRILQAPGSEASPPPDTVWVSETLAAMTLREKIGQLIQVRVRGEFLNRHSETYRSLLEDIDKNRVGGLVLFAGNIYESAILLNELQVRSKAPLLVSADFERGASFRIEDTTSFPWTMAIGATGSEEFAYREGEITAREARALGVHWIFAPVVDVNNNPGNPVINIRSYGEDPQLVARLGSAFIRGARAGNVLTTAKHFPGHGDTATDTHIGLAVVPSDIERLNSVELIPFRSAVAAGVDAIMTAHVAVPQVTGDAEIPATLSKEILTGLLRGALKFHGLVVTDAMEMGGITNKYWCGLAAVRAIEAGADVVLLPTDTAVAINEIERAVARGDIPVSRIDESAAKILRAKSGLGLDRNRTVSVECLTETVAAPDSEALAQDIADHSITAVKDQARLLPVDPAKNPEIFSLVLDSGLDTSPGLAFRTEMRKMYPSMRSEWANALITDDQIEEFAKRAANSDTVVCSTFARLSSGRDISAIPEGQQKIVQKLIASGRPVIWIAFGNPYVLERFPKIGTYLCTFSDADVSQRAAARAVSGAIAVTGKMPVSIPGHAQAGEGLEIPKLEMVLKSVRAETGNTSSYTFTNTREIIDNYIKSGLFLSPHITVGLKGYVLADTTYFPVEDTNPDIIDLVRLMADNHAGFRTILLAMLATESGSLLLDAPLEDYLPEYGNTDFGRTAISDLLVDLSEKHPVTGGMTSNQRLVEATVSRAAGSIDRLISGYPPGTIPVEKLFSGTSADQDSDSVDPYSVSLKRLPVFLQTLLNNGIYDHKRIFKPATIARFTVSGNKGKSLGWIKTHDIGWTDRLFSSDSFGFINTTGLFMWVDPKKELFIALDTSKYIEKSAFSAACEKICQSIVNEIRTH